MITLSFAQKESIGFQYVLDALRTNSPYGEERVRELKPFRRADRGELLRPSVMCHLRQNSVMLAER